MTDLAGVVVAGGYSRRFGDSEKALAAVDGRPMIRRVAEPLAARTDRLVVNCREDQREAFVDALTGLSPLFAVDPTPDCGPAAGLRTGLRLSGASRAVVAACDLPLIDRSTVDLLAGALAERDAGQTTDCAVPVVDGRRQPLCAAYEVDTAVRACTTSLRYGEGSLRGALATLSVAEIPESRVRARADPAAFRSVDTPAALRAVRSEEADAPVESG